MPTDQHGTRASRFIAECLWPSVTHSDVVTAAERLRAAVARTPGIAADGWILVRDDEVVFYLFRAPSPELVRALCETAGVDVERVVEIATSATA